MERAHHILTPPGESPDDFGQTNRSARVRRIATILKSLDREAQSLPALLRGRYEICHFSATLMTNSNLDDAVGRNTTEGSQKRLRHLGGL